MMPAFQSKAVRLSGGDDTPQSGGHGVANSLLVNRKHYVMFGKFDDLMQSRVRSFVVLNRAAVRI